MKNKTLIFAAVAFTIASGAAAISRAADPNPSARKNNATGRVFMSKVIGTVESINANQITVRNKHGNAFTFTIGNDSKIVEKHSEQKQATDIQVGNRVSVRYNKVNNAALRIDLLEPVGAPANDE